MKYHFEISEPDDLKTVRFHAKSDTPFGAISVGDILHCGDMLPGDRLEVSGVEHLFWESGGVVTQKICIHTKNTAWSEAAGTWKRTD